MAWSNLISSDTGLLFSVLPEFHFAHYSYQMQLAVAKQYKGSFTVQLLGVKVMIVDLKAASDSRLSLDKSRHALVSCFNGVL
jgi:hypothetical protein